MNLHCFCDSEFLRQWLSVSAAHKNLLGTFLMVHWLRLCSPNAGGAQVQSLVRELDPTCRS